MGTHSSTLSWKIPWTEEPDRLRSMGSLEVRHGWASSRSLFIFMHWRRQWQPTPVFLPGESQGQRSPGGLPSMWSHRIGHDWSDLAATQQQQQQQGIWVWAQTLRVYKVFTKTDRGPLPWACRCNKLHSTICINLLSKFVSRNMWLQHPDQGSNPRSLSHWTIREDPQIGF